MRKTHTLRHKFKDARIHSLYNVQWRRKEEKKGPEEAVNILLGGGKDKDLGAD